MGITDIVPDGFAILPGLMGIVVGIISGLIGILFQAESGGEPMFSQFWVSVGQFLLVAGVVLFLVSPAWYWFLRPAYIRLQA